MIYSLVFGKRRGREGGGEVVHYYFWKKDPEAAIKKAREWTITYANQ